LLLLEEEEEEDRDRDRWEGWRELERCLF